MLHIFHILLPLPLLALSLSLTHLLTLSLSLFLCVSLSTGAAAAQVRIDVHGARLIARVDNSQEEVYLKGLNHEYNYGVSTNLPSVVLVGGECQNQLSVCLAQNLFRYPTPLPPHTSLSAIKADARLYAMILWQLEACNEKKRNTH